MWWIRDQVPPESPQLPPASAEANHGWNLAKPTIISFFLRLSSEEVLQWSQSFDKLITSKLILQYNNSFFLFQINIDSPVRNAITRNIQEATQSCFDEAQRIIYMHMERDSYPRFLESNFYQKLKHSLQTPGNNSMVN
ncbi:hypothetical protein Q9233_001271 [Columba guinea]|nr:hypothetical protein Q9233_001271 [Columba guinea]